MRAGNMVRLPQLSNSLDKLGLFDLKELISELLMRNFSDGSYKGKAVFKPLWWPKGAGWPYKQVYSNKILMVEVVKSCYEFYGLDSLLLGPKCHTPEPSKSTRLKVREEKGRRKGKKNLDDQPLMAKENLENSPLNSEMVKKSSDYIVDSAEVHGNSLLPKPDLRRFQIESAAQCRRSQAKAKVTTKLNYLNGLGLITKTRAAHLSSSSSRRQSECAPDFEILDDDVIVITPLSPTPSKSLISQLSRDASPFGSQGKRCLIKEEDDSDDASSHASDKDIKLPNSYRLFSIDLCSELGSRVRPHLASLNRLMVTDGEERKEGVLAYEHYCHTPHKEVPKEKLRDRLVAGYPICYKKRPPKHSHTFCFNKTQRRERLMVLRTGLSQQARQLERELKSCSVQLNKLSPDVIRAWRQKRQQTPRTSPLIPLKKIEAEVIAISSDEETDISGKRPAPANSAENRRPAKKLKSNQAPAPANSAESQRPAKKLKSNRASAMLFRCHLCNASLTCYDNARQVIVGHFRNLHKVFTIDLIEQQDAHNNRVMSIVEVALPVNATQSLWQKPSSVVDLTLEDDDDVIVKHRGISRQLFC